MKKKIEFKLLNKKAELNETYLVLIQIIIALAIYVALQRYIDSVAEDTLFEKYYLANDLALFANVVYGSPGDIDYVYANYIVELDKFEFEFKNQRVRIDEVKDKGKLIIERAYGEDVAYTASSTPASGQNQIVFSKMQDKIEID